MFTNELFIQNESRNCLCEQFNIVQATHWLQTPCFEFQLFSHCYSWWSLKL